MADVSFGHMRRRGRGRADRIMTSLEGMCRAYDNGITRVIWIVAFVVGWLIVADALVSGSDVRYVGAWSLSTTLPVPYPHSRAEARTLHRVSRVLAEQCDRGDAVVVGPQVQVDGKPYMYRIMRLHFLGCKELINPVVVVSGRASGECKDEHDGVSKTTSRAYPITVHASGPEHVSLMELADVCTFMHALSLLDSQW